MIKIEDFIAYDSETLYDKNWGYNPDCLYEIYGKTQEGILFEKDLNNHNQILLHIGDGIKKAENHLYEGSCFFRKNREGSKFFSNYKDYKDFDFIKKETISEDYIINIVKRFIYMECPTLWESTCMGGGRKGVLGDTNWMYGTFLFEDGKEYTIIKKLDTVKIFEGNKDMYAFSEEEELCSFILEEELYTKALRLNKLRRFVALNSFGKIDIELMEEFTKLYKELDEVTKLNNHQ